MSLREAQSCPSRTPGGHLDADGRFHPQEMRRLTVHWSSQLRNLGGSVLGRQGQLITLVTQSLGQESAEAHAPLRTPSLL